MKSDISASVNVNIKAPVSKVWNALTKPELIKQYFFGTDTVTDWIPGHPITFSGEWQGKSYQDKGTVLAFKPNKLVRYNYWSSMSGIEDRPENYVVITYELSGEDENVTVTISQDNIPDEKTKAHSIENWKKVMNDLKSFVEKDYVAA